jgi:subtilisin family serine protease
MELTQGRPEIGIGLLDGPVALNEPDLASEHIHLLSSTAAACRVDSSVGCTHGTFVAGVLSAKRGSVAPAVCPQSTLVVRPIFVEAGTAADLLPSATPGELAAAILEVIEADVRVINLSAAFAQPSSGAERELENALDYALLRGVIVVAAAGNQGAVGSSVITRHHAVIPVIAYDLQGRPLGLSNLSASMGRRGLGAAGSGVVSLGKAGQYPSSGTSLAAPFVTGAIALLWSEFPSAPMMEIRHAITQSASSRRTTIVPPLMNAWAAYQFMSKVS